jgi:hypothetical protein
LTAGHISENCLAGNCKTCLKKHNSLSHFENTESVPSDRPLIVASTSHHVQSHDKNILLSTAIVQVTDKDGNKHQQRALLDSGSQSNFLTESAAQKSRRNNGQESHKHLNSVKTEFIQNILVLFNSV